MLKCARTVLLGCASIILLATHDARADTFTAPAEVMANSNGSFSYEWKLNKGPGSALIASFGWYGDQNVQGGLIADCFCDSSFCLIREGDSLRLQVQGQLTDSTAAGRVLNYVGFCSSQGPSSYTVINPHLTQVDDTAPRLTVLRNEPNPFSPRTTFRYALHEPGRVQLRIYDLAGRSVATVVDENQAAGQHAATWNAGAASSRLSGVHFARLTAPGQIESRRIVIAP